MSLHIVIGFDAQGNSAQSHCVYTGKSKSEAQAAMDASNAARFEVFSNVTGVRKNNGGHNPAKPVVVATSDDDLQIQITDLQSKLDEALAELEKLRADYLSCVKSESDLRAEILGARKESDEKLSILANQFNEADAAAKAFEGNYQQALTRISELESELAAAKASAGKKK